MVKGFRLLFVGCLLLVAAGAWAQDEQDASRLLQPDILGSSRYVGMGGAFVALGGDITAVKDNPAALGVYRKTDFSFSLAVPTSVSNASWYGIQQGTSKKTSFLGGHAGLAINVGGKQNRTSGLVCHTFGFSYQRVKNFNRTLSLSGSNQASSITDLYAQTLQSDNYSTASTLSSSSRFEDVNQAWPSVQAYNSYLVNYDSVSQTASSLLRPGETVENRYYMEERGYVDEYDFAWGCNISNIAYLGAGLSIYDMRYRLDADYQEAFNGLGGGMVSYNLVSTSGTGFSMNIGAIVVPVDWLRLGASIRTPLWWNLSDNNSGTLTTTTAYTTNQYFSTPTNYVDYRMNQPFKFNAGVGFVIGKWALLSGEFEYNRYSQTKYKVRGSSTAYSDVNQNMPYAMKDVSVFKAGVEVKPVEWMAVRAGYDYMRAGTPKNYNHQVRYNTVRTDSEWSRFRGTHYISGGIGFRGTWWYADVAYQYRCALEDYYPYSTAAYGPKGKFSAAQAKRSDLTTAAGATVESASNRAQRHTITATFGMRF